MRRFLVLLISLLAVLGVTLAGSAAQAKPVRPPALPKYVALGDSYSAGTGLTPYSSTTCLRSATQAYPTLLAGTSLTLTFTACSGATIDSMLATQLVRVKDAKYVTLTIGGNDAGFRDVISDCVDSTLTDGCSASGKAAAEAAVATLAAELAPALGTVQAKYPQATVYIAGYPALFGDNLTANCPVGNYNGWLPMWVTPSDAQWLNAMAGQLNAAIQAAAGRVGATYVDAASAFDGHGLCDTSPAWVNGAVLDSAIPFDVNEKSFHPTADGQSAGYATAFRGAGFPSP